MRLSVIIVNYNVCYFLEQCLYTVLQATKGITAEIIVVDNASSDDTRILLPREFPTVRFIWNEDNPGFGKANNQALALSAGEYIVLLNPDTLVPQNLFSTCLAFLADHPDAGAVGMRMYDGKGSYLPESKRGFPGAATSFFKLSGLIHFFPRNATISRYYLGQLSPDEVHPVEVLAGAFMIFRRQVYERVGGFDEDFFMYGEDIDLSYRISLAGFTNYYLPFPGIVHFKGESTPHNPAARRHFYEAMEIFVRKYYPKQSFFKRAMMRFAIKSGELVSRIANRKTPATNRIIKASWRISGDRISSLEIQQLSAEVQIDPNEKDRVIYALGKEFGMQEVLESWRPAGPPEYMRFHGEGTSCIVGSDDKNGSGDALVAGKIPLV
jgi:GT2 family glycosyltransferase